MTTRKPITRIEALRLCEAILLKAESERLAIAEIEAQSIDLDMQHVGEMECV